METKNLITFYDIMNTPQVNDVVYKFDGKIQESQRLLNENRLAVDAYRTVFQNGIQQYGEYVNKINSLKTVPPTPETENQKLIWMNEAQQIWPCINQKYGPILASIRMIIDFLTDAQRFLIDDRLAKWKYRQILAGYGDENKKLQSNSNENKKLQSNLNENEKLQSNLNEKYPHLYEELDNIQLQFEKLFECVLNTYTLLDIIRNCHNQANCIDTFEVKASSDVTTILKNLIWSSFIIDDQPPQVIKKDTRFEARLRLLLPKYVNISQESGPKVTILSESQIRQLKQQSERQKKDKTGDILMENCIFENDSKYNHRLICILRNLQLKKIVRSDKKSSESVMDEKFSLLFEYKIQIKNMSFNVWATSLPVTVAVHGNQEHEGYATITWDNSFFAIDRIPFTVCTEVPWPYMKWALCTRFYYQTGCLLTEEHLDYLYEKLFGSSPKSGQTISWIKFCKQTLDSRSFSFFHWFYEATKLTRLHLSEQWNKGLIHGFISKDKAREILLACYPGTFLLRFSDSELGGISVAWVQIDENGSKDVEHMQPFTLNDFENPKRSYGDSEYLSIGDLIKDLNQCTILFPNIPKETAFSEYFTPIIERKNGYVPKKRTFVTPSNEKINSNISSPCSYSPNSPQIWQSPSSYSAQGQPSFSNADEFEWTIEEIVKSWGVPMGDMIGEVMEEPTDISKM